MSTSIGRAYHLGTVRSPLPSSPIPTHPIFSSLSIFFSPLSSLFLLVVLPLSSLLSSLLSLLYSVVLPLFTLFTLFPFHPASPSSLFSSIPSLFPCFSFFSTLVLNTNCCCCFFHAFHCLRLRALLLSISSFLLLVSSFLFSPAIILLSLSCFYLSLDLKVSPLSSDESFGVPLCSLLVFFSFLYSTQLRAWVLDVLPQLDARLRPPYRCTVQPGEAMVATPSVDERLSVVFLCCTFAMPVQTLTANRAPAMQTMVSPGGG